MESFVPSRVLFGAAYYAEYHREDRTERDLDLMREAGFTVIRVGESVWSTWEPEDGVFDLDWLQPVLDGAHRRGIKVILGTPTYAVPPWLQAAHPEIAAERSTGHQVPWGARQEVDYTHPAFLFHAERTIRKVVGRYAGHPAVIGYQVDNEPGLELFHNPATFRRFTGRLRAQYGDVETLNREWGLTYWSHRIADWSELWTPHGNTVPQYDLAWRRFQADLTTEFIGWQAEIVREYARPGQFVTTCLAYSRPALHDAELTERLDVNAGNPYYGMQDHLDALADLPAPTPFTTSGVAGLFRQADRLYSSKQGRFLVTETNATSIGGADFNLPPYPGQLRQAALALVSRGAAMVEYWHWHTLPYGTETYWGGVMPHSLVPGRVYEEVGAIGKDLAAVGERLDSFEPDGDVALLWSTDSRYAMEFQPPLQQDGRPDRLSYQRIFDAFHRGVIESGAQARVLHVEQARCWDATALAARFPVLVAAGLYITADEDLQLLNDYVAAGGHLVLGIRSGYADEEARARISIAPPGLTEVAGVRYEEYSLLREPVPLRAEGSLTLGDDGAATEWADGLIPDDAEVLARYRHRRFGDFAAITTRRRGSGQVTTVGCLPSRGLARDLFRWAVPERAADTLVSDRSLPVTVASGTVGTDRRAWFIFNWSWEERPVTLERPVTSPFDSSRVDAGEKVVLGPWDATVLLDS